MTRVANSFVVTRGVAITAAGLMLVGCASSGGGEERTAAATRSARSKVPALDVERVVLRSATAEQATTVVPSTTSATTAASAPASTLVTPTTLAAPTTLQAPATSLPTSPPEPPRTVIVTVPVTVPAGAPAPPPTSPPATSPPATTPPTTPPTAPPSTRAKPTTNPPRTTATSAATTQAPPTTSPAPARTPGQPAPTAGFDGTTIRVGVLTTTTNPVWGQIGKALLAGIEARTNEINRRGGIAGKYRVQLDVSDTNYDPAATAQAIDVTGGNVVGYASILGTPSVERVEPLLRERQLLAGAASQEARWANAPTLLPVFNSYQVQAINGIGYFLESTGRPNATVCALSVATSYGESGAEGVRFAKEKFGFTAGPMETIATTNTSLAPNITTLRNAGCQAVMLTTTPQQTLAAVLTGRALGFSPRWIIMGASFSDRLVTPQTGPLFEQGAWVVGDGVGWGEAGVAGMTEIRDELIAANHRYWTENPDVGLTFGWTQARVFEAVLERAVARGDLSHAGLVAAAREVGAVDTRGLGSPIDYSATSRLANARTTVFAVDGSYRNAIRVLVPSYTSSAAQSFRPS